MRARVVAQLFYKTRSKHGAQGFYFVEKKLNEKRKQLIHFDYQSVNSPCSRPSTARASSVLLNLSSKQELEFKPILISARIFIGLFSKQ